MIRLRCAACGCPPTPSVSFRGLRGGGLRPPPLGTAVGRPVKLLDVAAQLTTGVPPSPACTLTAWNLTSRRLGNTWHPAATSSPWLAPAHRSPRSSPRYCIAWARRRSALASASCTSAARRPRGHRTGLVPPPAALRDSVGRPGSAIMVTPDAWRGGKDGCGPTVGPTSHITVVPPPFGSGRTTVTPRRCGDVSGADPGHGRRCAVSHPRQTRKALSRMADARLEKLSGSAFRCLRRAAVLTPWSPIRSRFCGWWRPSRSRPSVEPGRPFPGCITPGRVLSGTM